MEAFVSKSVSILKPLLDVRNKIHFNPGRSKPLDCDLYRGVFTNATAVYRNIWFFERCFGVPKLTLLQTITAHSLESLRWDVLNRNVKCLQYDEIFSGFSSHNLNITNLLGNNDI